MNIKVKNIMLVLVLLLIVFEIYTIIFLKVDEKNSAPVVVKENKVISINSIYDEILLMGEINILETNILDNKLVTKINIKGNREEILEKINLLNNYRIINYKISRIDEKIDLNMEIVKK